MEPAVNKKVKIGLVGCGRWGKNHANALSKLPCEFVGVADGDETKKDFIESLGTRYFHAYQELLPLVDAIVVAVPTSLHFPVVKDALEQGKHVLVEKPVTLTPRDTKELVDLAKEKNLILSVGYIYRFHPVVRELKRRLQDVKNIHYITARCIGGQNKLWADSGAIVNFGVHFIDILNFIFGVRPVKVYAIRQNLLDAHWEDSASVKLIYPKFFVTLELSCVHPEKARDMWVIGDTQKLYADFNAQTMKAYNFSLDEKGNISGSTTAETPDIEKGDPLKEELTYFINSVANYDSRTYEDIHNIGREEPHTTLICETALQSAIVGRELKVSYEN